MAIMGTLGADGVARALTLGDQRAIQAAPGVGPKLAQRIILELKSKAPSVMAMGANLVVTAEADDSVLEPLTPMAPRKAVAPNAAQNRAAFTADALSALLNLGYTQGDAAQAIATIASEQPEADTASLIRAALKLLAPRR
jgi:Holliday junction DNA helicase RuvA